MKRKKKRIIILAVLAFCLVALWWLLTPGKEVEFENGESILFPDEMVIKSGSEKGGGYGINLVFSQSYCSVRAEMDVDCADGNLKKIVIKNTKNNKTIAKDINGNSAKISFNLEQSGLNVDYWGISYVSDIEAHGKIKVRVYARKKRYVMVKEFLGL